MKSRWISFTITLNPTATGAKSATTGIAGSPPMWMKTGVPTAMARGSIPMPAGPGSPASLTVGRCITTAVGPMSRRSAGSGYPAPSGDPAGSPGATAHNTSVGLPCLPRPPSSISIGFSSWVDDYYDIGPSSYCFVENRHFGSRRLRDVFVDRRQNLHHHQSDHQHHQHQLREQRGLQWRAPLRSAVPPECRAHPSLSARSAAAFRWRSAPPARRSFPVAGPGRFPQRGGDPIRTPRLGSSPGENP